MAEALAKCVPNFCFFGFSYTGEPKKQNYKQLIFPKKYPKPVRNLKVIKAVNREKTGPYGIYTRDLFFAIYFTLTGKPTLWECHQSLSPKTRFWLKLLSLFPDFYTLSISAKLAEQQPANLTNNFTYHRAANLPSQHKILEKPVLKPKTALYTGALHKGKDIESLIPLFTHYPSWNFIIAGGRPNEVSQYRKAFEQYDNVDVIGRIDPELVHSYQKAADLLLYPLTKTSLYWEVTSPLKLFEYLSTGRPILASCIGSVSEIINEENAFIYTKEDGILNAFEQFIAADKDLLDRMSVHNISLIKTTYNWDARAKFIIEKIFKHSI